MLHGVKIDGVDTLTRYGLCLLADVEIPAPAVRTTRITVPGMDGSIDASQALTGGPVYDDVDISMALFARKADTELQAIRRQLLNAYHGREVQLALPHDAAHYYLGTLSIGNLSGYGSGQIPVTLHAGPWRYKLEPTVVAASDLSATYKQLTLANEARPVIPTITVAQDTTLLWGGDEIALSAGTHRRPEIRLAAGDNILSAKVASGTGSIEIKDQEATL